MTKAHKRKTNRKPGTQDDCGTPAYALAPLIPWINKQRYLKVWEPCYGRGLLANALAKLNTYDIWTTDVVKRKGIDEQADYLSDYSPPGRWDVTITNIPWSLKYDFLHSAYAREMPFAFLVPAETVAAGTAHSLFRAYDEPGIIWMSPRIDFKMPNKGWKSTSHISTVWITHGMGFPPSTYYDLTSAKQRWLEENPRCRPQR